MSEYAYAFRASLFAVPIFVAATGPLCRCGSRQVRQVRVGAATFRCGRGHFARAPRYRAVAA